MTRTKRARTKRPIKTKRPSTGVAIQRPIHAEIKRRREALNLTQGQLAERLDVDKTAISHWETGSAAPHWMREQAVADALGCSLADLRGGA